MVTYAARHTATSRRARLRSQHSLGVGAEASLMRPHHHRGRSRQMMPLERTGAFTLACIAVLLVVAFAMVFLS
jgi:hypothetical protein